MKRHLANLWQRLAKALLSLLFIAYLASITLFVHTHHLNGLRVVHSHPFSSGDSQNPGHQHSRNAIVLIDLLSAFIATGIVALVLCVFQKNLFPVLVMPIRQKAFNDKGFYNSSGLRAPPFHD